MKPITIKLGEAAITVDYGVTASAADSPVGPKFLRITDIQNGRVDWESVPWCEADTKTVMGSKLESGDIVFARTGATTGKSFLIRECPDNSVFASYLIRLRLKDSFDARFVSHFFQTPDYWAQITKSARGVAQPGVNATTLKLLDIPSFPLSEQKRIAEILDRAETLRAKRRAALALLDELTQSIFLDMFGDPVGNIKSFPIKPLHELGKVSTGGTPPGTKDGMFGGSIPFVTPGDLESDEPIKRTLTAEGAAETKTIRAGATFVCCIGATIGKMGNATQPSAFNQQLNAVDWNNCIDDDYGLSVLRFYKRKIVDAGSSTTLPILKKSSFERIAIPVPPLERQREFTRCKLSVENLAKSFRASLTELDVLFASLQHSAFRGEL